MCEYQLGVEARQHISDNQERRLTSPNISDPQSSFLFDLSSEMRLAEAYKNRTYILEMIVIGQKRLVWKHKIV